ncbi:MAG: Ldh family oxidoreductase, partial [Gemmatimonadota bacterium]|nr:Ldh family oxidoreductase [Gemmatimonadota bacterium]
MNVPPTDGLRVAVTDLEALVVEIFKAVPIPEDHAQLIASKLVECDLRGVVSHGTLQVSRYVRSFQDGTVNPNPQIHVLKEGPTTAALSGDGGLGYLVATKGM